jgi:hypothetical protein
MAFSLSAIPKNQPRKSGAFFWVWRREVRREPYGSTNRKAIWAAAGAPAGGQDASCNRVLSLSLSPPFKT